MAERLGRATDSPLVVLLVGLLAIWVLFYATVLAVGLPPGVTVAVGALEVVVAWRTRTPRSARAIRSILLCYGLVTFAVGVFNLLTG